MFCLKCTYVYFSLPTIREKLGMELEQLREEAKLSALEEIKMLLVRPGHMERIDRYKKRTIRKKASLEAQLKTSMQNQLEGIRVGDKQLRRSVTKTKEIDDS